MESSLVPEEVVPGVAATRVPGGARLALGFATGVVGVVAAVLLIRGGAEEVGLAVLAAVAVAVAFLRPSLLAPALALALPAGAAYEVVGIQVSPLDAVACGGALGYLTFLVVARQERRVTLAHVLYGAFVACVAVSSLGPADDSERVRTALVLGALGFAFHALTTRLVDAYALDALLVCLGGVLLVETGLAFFQYVDAYSDRFALREGAIVYPLPDGTLVHANALAQFLVLGALTVAALALARQGAMRWIGLLVATLAIPGVLVTFSRASWVALAAGVAVYALDRRLRRGVLVLGAVSVVVGAMLALATDGAIGARISSLFDPETGSLSGFRLELVKRAAAIAGDHPLFGVGVFREVGIYAGRPDLATHPHNLFLGLAVFFGIPAALAFALLVGHATRRLWQRRRIVDGLSQTTVGLLAVLAALLVNGLFEYPFWSGSLTALVVVVLGVCVAVGTLPTQASRTG